MNENETKLGHEDASITSALPIIYFYQKGGVVGIIHSVIVIC